MTAVLETLPLGMRLDAEHLTRSLWQVTDHADGWAQNFYGIRYPSCLTTCCLAGTVVSLAGLDLVFTPMLPGSTTALAYTVADGRGVEQAAYDVLGLDYGLHELDPLFHYYGADLGELWRRASVLTDGAIAVPAEFAGDR